MSNADLILHLVEMLLQKEKYKNQEIDEVKSDNQPNCSKQDEA